MNFPIWHGDKTRLKIGDRVQVDIKPPLGIIERSWNGLEGTILCGEGDGTVRVEFDAPVSGKDTWVIDMDNLIFVSREEI